MSGHTPGPWFFVETGVESAKPSCFSVRIHCDSRNPAGLKEVHNNANLIAAAPDLLEALIGARKIIAEAARDYQDNRDLVYESIAILPKIDAAIARAKGEA